MENSLLSGICPKCGSEEVYVNEHETIDPIMDYNLFELSKGRGKSYSDTYYCLDCGYLEYYLRLSQKQKTKLMQDEGWQRVHKRKNDER